MKHFTVVATVIAGLFCLPALVEWGSHHLPVIGCVAFLLVCILFAVLGSVADYLGGEQ